MKDHSDDKWTILIDMKTPTKMPIFPQIDGQVNTDPAAFPQTTLRFGQTESKIHVGVERTEQVEKPPGWSREEAFPSRKWIVRSSSVRGQRPQFQVGNHWPEPRTEFSSKTEDRPFSGVPAGPQAGILRRTLKTPPGTQITPRPSNHCGAGVSGARKRL